MFGDVPRKVPQLRQHRNAELILLKSELCYVSRSARQEREEFVTQPRFKVRNHYSGVLMGYCTDDPSIIVMANDHEELTCLMTKALAERSTGTEPEAGFGPSR
jgi:hypothetical protein